MFKKRKEEEELKTQSANTFVETYLLLIIMKQTIKKEVTEEQWPFTFDILKDLQFSWFIMKSEWVLKKKKITLCVRTGCLHPLQTQWFVVILMVSTLHTLTSVCQLSSPYCSLYISQSADKENLRRASLAGDHFLFSCDHNV